MINFLADDTRVQHSNPIIHPCITSKELDSSYSLDASEVKTRVQKKKVIVRSRYFQNNNTEENDQANTKTNVSAGVDEAMVANEHETSDGEPKSVFGSVDVKTTVDNRKLHTSRYFRDNNQENANERLIETPNIEGFAMKRKFSIVDDSLQKVSTLSSFNLCV